MDLNSEMKWKPGPFLNYRVKKLEMINYGSDLYLLLRDIGSATSFLKFSLNEWTKTDFDFSPRGWLNFKPQFISDTLVQSHCFNKTDSIK